MKKSLKRISVFCVLLTWLLVSSCTKYVPGPKGDPGKSGEKGNLVQTNIDAFKILPSAWTFDGSNWNTSVYVGAITDEIIKNGEVKAYMNVSNEWRSLPYALGDLFTQMKIENSYLHFQRSKIHGGPPARPDTTTFRAIVFAPAI